ncbi:MAG: acetolactate synthase small subunit [Alphaproteobacteria bacterium]|nr:acetolactate synthase small subunit [Alphaproteobacteria bacterium]
MANINDAEERHVLAVLVDNEPGVLARVVGLFSGRGYNIETLTVAAVSEDETSSRINLVTTGTPMIIEQIKAQLERLVPVREVHDLTGEGPHVAHELALVKIGNEGAERREALRIADIFRARVVDTGADSFVFSLTGAPEKIDSFLQLMRNLGRTEISRSGVVALQRSPKDGVPNLGAGADND